MRAFRGSSRKRTENGTVCVLAALVWQRNVPSAGRATNAAILLGGIQAIRRVLGAEGCLANIATSGINSSFPGSSATRGNKHSKPALVSQYESCW